MIILSYIENQPIDATAVHRRLSSPIREFGLFGATFYYNDNRRLSIILGVALKQSALRPGVSPQPRRTSERLWALPAMN